MTDRFEVAILVDAQGAVRGFQALSAGADKAELDLQQLGKTGQAAADKLSKGARTASADLGKMGGVLGALNRAATGIAAASLVGFLSDSSRAAADASASNAALAQALDNAGTSADAYAESIAAAGQKALQLGFDDEDAADALAAMIGVTNDVTGSMQNLAIAEDLARAKHMSLAAASTLVGRVMAGNVGILKRYGIEVEAGATAEEALAQLQQRFGGQAEAYAATQRGAIDRLAVGWENLQESIGGAAGPLQAFLGVLPGATIGFQALGGFAGAATKQIRTLTAELRGGTGMITALGGAISPLGLAAGAAALGIGSLVIAEQEHDRAAASAATASRNLQVALEGIGDQGLVARFQALQQSVDDLSKTPIEFAPTADPSEIFRRIFAQADDLSAGFKAALTDALKTGTAANAPLEHLITTAERLRAAVGTDGFGLEDAARTVEDWATVAEHGSAAAQAKQSDYDQELALGIVTGREYASMEHDLANATLTAGDAMNAASQAARTLSETQRQAISQIPALLKQAASEQAAAVRDVEQTRVGLAEDAFGSVTAVRERETAAQIKTAQQGGSAAAKAAQDAGRAQVREAEVAARGQTLSARRAADQQIAAAQDAEETQVGAAQSAADAQVAAADRAANAQINAADRAGHAQVRAAQVSGHEQTREAQLTATRQIAAADRWEEATSTAAKARADSIIEAANNEEDARVTQADAAADAEIAAAKRSTEAQLAQLERRASAQARAATETANRTIQQANDEAARRIRQSGGDPHVVGQQANRLAKIQKDAIDEQVRAQENAAQKQEQAQARIQAEEDSRIAAAEAKRDAIREDSAKRLAAIEEAANAEAAARTEAAARVAERIRTDAARRQSAVERQTTRATTEAQRSAAQDSARIQRTAARNSAAVQEATAAHVAEVQEAAAANTAAVTASANADADRVARSSAREVERERTDSARRVAAVQRSTARQTAAIQRSSDKDQEQAVHSLERIKLASAARVKAAEAETKQTVDDSLVSLANANAEAADILAKAGLVEQGANGVWTISLHPATAAAQAFIDSAFGPDAAAVSADGVITLHIDWTEYNRQLTFAHAHPPTLPVKFTAAPTAPVTKQPTAAPPVEVQYGPLTGAANGRVIRVGENGREDVVLPGGSYVRPHPASEAAGSGAGVVLNFHAPVYGLADFEAKVGEAALRAVGKHLPRALKERRRALGAT